MGSSRSRQAAHSKEPAPLNVWPRRYSTRTVSGTACPSVKSGESWSQPFSTSYTSKKNFTLRGGWQNRGMQIFDCNKQHRLSQSWTGKLACFLRPVTSFRPKSHEKQQRSTDDHLECSAEKRRAYISIAATQRQGDYFSGTPISMANFQEPSVWRFQVVTYRPSSVAGLPFSLYSYLYFPVS